MTNNDWQTSSDDRFAYAFDAPPRIDRTDWPTVLGGKGASLARMQQLGLPVPPGFTLPTHLCRRLAEDGWFAALDTAIEQALCELEASIGRKLGALDRPLLVSVRSGAPVSMPGMMDTVLNVGMNADVAVALGRWAGDERFGWDTYRRFLESFATIVAGVSREVFDRHWDDSRNGRTASSIGTTKLGDAVGRLRAGLADEGYVIPDDPRRQVTLAVQAVFASRMSPRAIAYCKREGLSASSGTAATVQAMVFGNLGAESGTGVVFTRDPSTGSDGLMGDFLVGGQGEDVVAGTHRTQPISAMVGQWPTVAEELATMASALEQELRDLVDIEFTVEDGTLWLLQARVGKRSPQAALRLAVAMAEDPSFPLDRVQAVARVADLLDEPPTVARATDDDVTVLAMGLAASPGRAVGQVCVDADDAVRRAGRGEAVILVRPETSPADVHGMAEARGLVTTLGGLVSHAAVVARSWGIPAVVGVDGLTVNRDGIMAGGVRVGLGEQITVDGDNGRVLLGAHQMEGEQMSEVRILRSWRDGAGSAPGSADDPVTALAVTAADGLRVLALKGMATGEVVASVLRATVGSTVVVLETLVADGHARTGPGDRFMLTPDGTAAVDAAFEREATTATPVIEPHLERFHRLNLRFKEVVTSWQMREVDGEQVLNDHTDAEYDALVLAALGTEIHVDIIEIVDVVSVAVTRLEIYDYRFQVALDGIAGGDLELVAHPLRDSYHTVWFELHEELIRLTGRNRADEAAAGRA